MTKKLKITLSSLSIISVIALVPIVAVACSDNSSNKKPTSQTIIDSYIKNFNNNLSKIIGKSTIQPSSIPTIAMSNTTIGDYFTNLPSPIATPTITLSFLATVPDDATGTIKLSVALTGPDAITTTSNAIVISGFLTTNQNTINAINNYINEFNSSKNITGKSTVLSSDIPSLTTANISSYFDNFVSIPAGSTATFDVTNTSDIDGTLSLSVTLIGLDATKTTSNAIVISGFLTTNQNAINNYINTFNTSKNITGKSTVLPSNIPSLTTANIPSYFDNFTPIPAGSTATFDVTNTSDTDGKLSLSVTLIGLDATKTTSNAIVISGFLTTNQNAINTYISTFNNSSKIITGISTVLPSTINPISNIEYQNISKYFDNIATIPKGITATFDVSNPSDIDGKLSLSVTLTSPDAITTTSNAIVISGFSIELAGQQLPKLSNYANYWATTPTNQSTLNSSSTETSLYITNVKTNTEEFNSSATLPSTGTALPTFITNINWPEGLSNVDVVSWTMNGNNDTGTATYTLVLNDKTTATLNVTGFMTYNYASYLAVTVSVGTDTTTPKDGIFPDTTDSLNNLGISINWVKNIPSNGLVVEQFGIVNSQPSKGTANFLIYFTNGIILSIPATSYKINNIQKVASAIENAIISNTKLTVF